MSEIVQVDSLEGGSGEEIDQGGMRSSVSCVIFIAKDDGHFFAVLCNDLRAELSSVFQNVAQPAFDFLNLPCSLFHNRLQYVGLVG